MTFSGFLQGAALLTAASFVTPAFAWGPNIVLVPGMNMGGDVWRPVHDRLVLKGFEVTVVQLPFTSLAADVGTVRRALERQEGPVILVGHSYGGMVATEVGSEVKVKALVYVAGFQPDIGETLAELNASAPSDLPQNGLNVSADGYFTVQPEIWLRDVANGLPEETARFTNDAQASVNSAIFTTPTTTAAWHDQPVWSVVATADRTVSPELQRSMSSRSGARTTELDGGHLLPLGYPDEVANVIMEVATSVREAN